MLGRNTIGNRLIASIGLMAFLTISVSLVAVFNWETVDTQLKTLVEKNIPNPAGELSAGAKYCWASGCTQHAQ